MNYADRLASKIETCGNPSVLGLDPRIEQMPKVVRELADERAADKTDRIRRSIRIFHELVIDATADIVPAVKLQLAFYEQYGDGLLETNEFHTGTKTLSQPPPSGDPWNALAPIEAKTLRIPLLSCRSSGITHGVPKMSAPTAAVVFTRIWTDGSELG